MRWIAQPVIALGLVFSVLSAAFAAAEPDPAALDSLARLARQWNSFGRHAEAEIAYRRALEIKLLQSPADDPALADILMPLAMEVSNQGRFREARALFAEAEWLVNHSTDPFDKPRLIAYRAIDAMNQHHFSQARDFARTAMEMRQTLAGSASGKSTVVNGVLARGELAHSLLIEAQASLQMNDLLAAEVASTRALEILAASSAPPASWRSEALLVLGEVNGRMARSEKAETLLKEGVSRQRDLFGDSKPTALALFALGRFYANSGRYDEAQLVFRQGVAIMNLPAQQGTSLAFDAVAAFFELSLEMARQNRDSEAKIQEEMIALLHRVQMGGSNEINIQTALRLALRDPGIALAVRDLQDAELAQGETRLALVEEAAKSAEDRKPDRQRQLLERYRWAEAKANTMRRSLAQLFPEYGRLTAPMAPTLADLRAGLGEEDGFISLAMGERFGVVGLVTSQAARVSILDLSADQAGDMVRLLLEGMQLQAGRLPNFDRHLAHQLYEKLFASFAVELKPIRHLHSALAGALVNLPLATLVTDKPKSADLGQTAWLIRRFAVTQWPSASAFVQMRQQAKVSHASKSLLGLANPDFSLGKGVNTQTVPIICRVAAPYPAALLGELHPLPETAQEIRKVGQLLKARPEDLLIGREATEANLRSHSLEDYRVLYFATHGLLPNELPCQSEASLALTAPIQPPQSRGEDGLLEASEIAGLKLDADLVVLSACNTAVAATQSADGSLVSLADVFFHAGSRSVLASQWSVPSLPTSQLMSALFSRHVTHAGQSYAEDLRQAQLSLTGHPQTAHPAFWAGFTLIGDAGNLISARKLELQ